MVDLLDLTETVRTGRHLTLDEAASAASALALPEVQDAAKIEFLRLLSLKGETPLEVAGFAKAFRSLARDPRLGSSGDTAIDIVGTGGDHTGGFNVSTVVTYALAAAGVKVMKHGNRGITSKCGSADLFAALGVAIEAPPEKMRAAFEQLGFAFFFAPAYHPAFKYVAPARKALAGEGRRTIFNLLGPLLNPGRPAQALVGVFSESWVSALAEALERTGLKQGLVGHGSFGEGRGIDEITTASENHVRGFGPLAAARGPWQAEAFGLARSPAADLLGGDVARNLALLESLLAGRGPAGLFDTICLNVSLALWIMGRTRAPAEGVATARDLLLGGAVERKIEEVREFFRA